MKTINISCVISGCDTAIVIECYCKKYVVDIGLNLKHNGNSTLCIKNHC